LTVDESPTRRTVVQSITRTIAIASLALAAVTSGASAEQNEETDARVAQALDRMERLEKSVDETEARAVAQEEQIREAAQGEQRPGRNGLSAYLEATEISAWMATSYNVNFRNPDKTTDTSGGLPAALNGTAGATNQGASRDPLFQALYGTAFNPFHPESNTFQLDQAWIGIDKAPTEQTRAGYRLDLAAGMANNGAAAGYGIGVYSASVSYLVPLLEGFMIEGGLLTSAHGAEVVQTVGNFNVSRGIVFRMLPVTNLGVTGTLDLGGGLTAMLGVQNNSSSLDGPTDSNNNKALTSRVNYSADKFSLGAGVNWGKNEAGSGADHLLFNTVASIDPTDHLSAYIDYTLNIRDVGGTRFALHGMAVAARLALRDTTGIALRGEVGVLGDPDAPFNDTLWTVTTTIDHALTDDLKSLIEIRYDGVSDGLAGAGGGFWNESGTAATENGQVLFIAQLVYEF